MNKNSKKTKPTPVQTVLIIIICSIAVMIWLYRMLPGKESDIHFELVKMIFQGLIIGGLGLWLKYLFDESARSREELKNRIAAKSEREARKRELLISIFLLLRSLCRVMIKRVEVGGMTLIGVTAQTIQLPSGEYIEYPDLLDQWQIYEPNGLSENAQQAFNQLQQYPDNLTDEMRDEIKSKLLKWKDYYGIRIRSLSSGESSSTLSIEDNEPEKAFD